MNSPIRGRRQSGDRTRRRQKKRPAKSNGFIWKLVLGIAIPVVSAGVVLAIVLNRPGTPPAQDEVGDSKSGSQVASLENNANQNKTVSIKKKTKRKRRKPDPVPRLYNTDYEAIGAINAFCISQDRSILITSRTNTQLKLGDPE